MEKESAKKLFKLFLKIIITAGAVYFVITKIDVKETVALLVKANIFWLFLAFLFFNFSKILSAFRLRTYLENIQVFMTGKTGVKLCYVGMFYNLFLPGGIGGDGYKVYLLKKNNKEKKLGKIVSGALLDRINGMLALIFLALILFYFTSLNYWIEQSWLRFLYFLSVLAFYPALFLLNKIFFKSFKASFITTNLQSLGVQILQVICSLFILLSLGVQSNMVDYLDLFLVSSVIAVLPFTIGGVGAREMVFIFGYEFLPIEKNTAVAFSLAFFLITLISSLAGAFISVEKDMQVQPSAS